MSKKRFTIKPQDDYWAVVDNYNKVCIINGIHTEIEAIWLCDFINEQQSDLIYLARFIGEFKVEEFKLKLRNLRILEEENEQLRKDKEILKERLRECRIKMDKFNCR